MVIHGLFDIHLFNHDVNHDLVTLELFNHDVIAFGFYELF